MQRPHTPPRITATDATKGRWDASLLNAHRGWLARTAHTPLSLGCGKYGARGERGEGSFPTGSALPEGMEEHKKELLEHCTSQLHIAHGQDGQIVAIPDEVLQSEFVTTYWAGIYYFPLVA